MTHPTAYRIAIGIACGTGLILLWINVAVGIIGDGPINLMYLGVLAIALAGALLAQFQPRGMAWTLFATALAQVFVPVVALLIWKAGGRELLLDPHSPHPPFHPGVVPVFALNSGFAALWIASAIFFRRADAKGVPAVG